MKQRGGYRGDLSCQIKVRVSRETYDRLLNLCEKRNQTIARFVRDLVTEKLAGVDRSAGSSSSMMSLGTVIVQTPSRDTHPIA